MIDIKDLSLLRITKVKKWAILFDYGDKHYLLHGNYEIGEGSWQELYERELNYYGQYKLKHIATNNCSTDMVADDYIIKQSGNTVVYKQIDKRYFAYKLTKRGFASGVMEDVVKKQLKNIQTLEAQIKKHEDRIRELEAMISKFK